VTLADFSRVPFLKAVTTSVPAGRLYNERTFFVYETETSRCATFVLAVRKEIKQVKVFFM